MVRGSSLARVGRPRSLAVVVVDGAALALVGAVVLRLLVLFLMRAAAWFVLLPAR